MAAMKSVHLSERYSCILIICYILILAPIYVHHYYRKNFPTNVNSQHRVGDIGTLFIVLNQLFMDVVFTKVSLLTKKYRRAWPQWGYRSRQDRLEREKDSLCSRYE